MKIFVTLEIEELPFTKSFAENCPTMAVVMLLVHCGEVT